MPFTQKLKVVVPRAACTCYVSIAGDYTDIGDCKRHGVTALLLNDSTDYSSKELKSMGYRAETHGVILQSLDWD